MQKLHLKYQTISDHSFEFKKVNLLFVFQVNCPGCFAYGFPVVNRLREQFGDELGYLGLSTAFEDFEMNTAENTIALIETGTAVGETRKMLDSQGLETYPEPISFPIASDEIIPPEALSDHKLIDKICHINPNFSIWAQFDQDLLRQKVRTYLTQQKKISFTFTVNQFRGTPTFVIFNDEMEIIEQWFGHVSAPLIENALEEALKSL
ncbi:MAG: hypothetical protein HEP71_17490 [Roseivirga sp.]|nr:hypothetical protein [Roseivirga sp.]